MPPATETWDTFRDLHSRSILQAATNNDEYKNATAHFHAPLKVSFDIQRKPGKMPACCIDSKSTGGCSVISLFFAEKSFDKN